MKCLLLLCFLFVANLNAQVQGTDLPTVKVEKIQRSFGGSVNSEEKTTRILLVDGQEWIIYKGKTDYLVLPTKKGGQRKLSLAGTPIAKTTNGNTIYKKDGGCRIIYLAKSSGLPWYQNCTCP